MVGYIQALHDHIQDSASVSLFMFHVFFLIYLPTRHGYGTDWRQLVVLTYAGLRGAVGLTLALIVQVRPIASFLFSSTSTREFSFSLKFHLDLG